MYAFFVQYSIRKTGVLEDWSLFWQDRRAGGYFKRHNKCLSVLFSHYYQIQNQKFFDFSSVPYSFQKCFVTPDCTLRDTQEILPIFLACLHGRLTAALIEYIACTISPLTLLCRTAGMDLAQI